MERGLGLLEALSTPKEVTPSRLKFDEECVLKCQEIINDWSSIFEDFYNIVLLRSGLNASEDVQHDLLRAKDFGQQKSAAFIKERLKHNEVPFYDPIRRNNLKRFTSLNLEKTLKIKDEDVIIRTDRDLFGRILILQERRGNCKSVLQLQKSFSQIFLLMQYYIFS